MIPVFRPRRAAAVPAALLLLGLLLAVGCERVPLLAPTGSTITLTAGATALPLSGSTTLIAQVIEASGQPPHDGTLVTFTTTLGTIAPSQATTDINGRVIVQFNSGTASGTATITATSGGAGGAATTTTGTTGSATSTIANVVKIAVGAAGVGKVIVSASPALVPAVGGTSTISAVAIDINGNVLPSVSVTFTSTAGTLSASVATTDLTGTAQTVLATSSQATVTASVGAAATPPATGTTTPATGQASGSVTVGIASAPNLLITPPATLTAGLPGSFTFAVTAAATNGSAVRDVTVNWGDGQTQDLGAITGNAVVAHVYRFPGTYNVSATLLDTAGNKVPVSTTVTVTSVTLTLLITPPSTPPGAGLPASFTFVATASTAGDAVRDVTVNWGDATATQDLGAIGGSATVSHVYTRAGEYTVVGTLTDTAGNSISPATVVTVIPISRPSIIITYQPPGPGHPVLVTFSIQITPVTGVGVVDASVTWGDGTSQDLGGTTSASVQHTYNVAGPFTVTVTVLDTTGQTTPGTTFITIS